MEKNKLLEQIRPDKEFIIHSKIRRSPLFARVLIWLSEQGKENNPIHPSEVRENFIIQPQSACRILTDFCLLGLIKKDVLSKNFICYILEMNSDKPTINKYVNEARKVLGI